MKTRGHSEPGREESSRREVREQLVLKGIRQNIPYRCIKAFLPKVLSSAVSRKDWIGQISILNLHLSEKSRPYLKDEKTDAQNQKRKSQLDVNCGRIVLYNPTLGKMLACHVNLKLYVSSLRAILCQVCLERRWQGSCTTSKWDCDKRRDEQFLRTLIPLCTRGSVDNIDIWDLDGHPLVVCLNVYVEFNHTLNFQKDNEWIAVTIEWLRIMTTKWFDSDRVHLTSGRLFHSERATYFT